jgi:hypothetical protein
MAPLCGGAGAGAGTEQALAALHGVAAWVVGRSVGRSGSMAAAALNGSVSARRGSRGTRVLCIPGRVPGPVSPNPPRRVASAWPGWAR